MSQPTAAMLPHREIDRTLTKLVLDNGFHCVLFCNSQSLASIYLQPPPENIHKLEMALKEKELEQQIKKIEIETNRMITSQTLQASTHECVGQLKDVSKELQERDLEISKLWNAVVDLHQQRTNVNAFVYKGENNDEVIVGNQVKKIHDQVQELYGRTQRNSQLTTTDQQPFVIAT